MIKWRESPKHRRGYLNRRLQFQIHLMVFSKVTDENRLFGLIGKDHNEVESRVGDSFVTSTFLLEEAGEEENSKSDVARMDSPSWPT